MLESLDPIEFGLFDESVTKLSDFILTTKPDESELDTIVGVVVVAMVNKFDVLIIWDTTKGEDVFTVVDLPKLVKFELVLVIAFDVPIIIEPGRELTPVEQVVETNAKTIN